jgi:hypothetical protein
MSDSWHIDVSWQWLIGSVQSRQLASFFAEHAITNASLFYSSDKKSLRAELL